jgi:hypothetical protein
MSKSYSELILFDNFQDRFDYLRIRGYVGEETFGHDRYLNQMLYRSKEWRDFRRRVIIRDNGCDLGIPGHEIFDQVLIHHINPLSLDDVFNRSPLIFDMDNVICVSHDTHNAIHYGNEQYLSTVPTERRPGDTCPWKSKEKKNYE